MNPETLILIQTWAIYLGLTVTTCLVVSSMLFGIALMAKSIFFWRYSVVANKIDTLLEQVTAANIGSNRQLALLSEALRVTLNPDFLSQAALDDLKEELGLSPEQVEEEEDTLDKTIEKLNLKQGSSKPYV